MEDKETVKKKYLDKIKKLTKYNESYFSKDKSIVSDKEYDELKKNNTRVRKKLYFFKS